MRSFKTQQNIVNTPINLSYALKANSLGSQSTSKIKTFYLFKNVYKSKELLHSLTIIS